MLTKELIINIYGEDFSNSDYLNTKDCAITRALKRAGFSKLKDCGTDISGYDSRTDNWYELPIEAENYETLTNRVVNSYKEAKHNKVEDFEFTLIFTKAIDLSLYK